MKRLEEARAHIDHLESELQRISALHGEKMNESRRAALRQSKEADAYIRRIVAIPITTDEL